MSQQSFAVQLTLLIITPKIPYQYLAQNMPFSVASCHALEAKKHKTKVGLLHKKLSLFSKEISFNLILLSTT